MTMGSQGIPEDFDSNIVNTIQCRLDGVEKDHDVALILAVESGSRAWGFSSANSDYDCRFLYCQRQDKYLSLWPKRDVIETPLDHIYDVNGWDIAKALRLLVKGNAVAIEWLTSPIIYRQQSAPLRVVTEFARKWADSTGLRRHYFHLATQQFERHLVSNNQWKVKTLFYALRPIAALKWLRLHPAEVILPMNLWALMAGAEMATETIERARNYAGLKSTLPEDHTVPSDPYVLSLIAEELSKCTDIGLASSPPDPERARAADLAFQAIILMPWISDVR